MKRVVILGGGVGGTIVANRLCRKLGREIARRDVTVTVVDAEGQHVYQPGFMYIAFGHEKPDKLQRPERTLLDERATLVVDEVVRIDEDSQTVELAGGDLLGYDQLVLATGSRIVPEQIEHFGTE